MGLLSAAMAGGVQGLGEGAAKVGQTWNEAAFKDDENAAQALRAQNLAQFESQLRESAAIAADQRTRAPYQRAASAAQGLIGSAIQRQNAPVPDELGGGPTPPTDLPLSPGKETGLKAQAYEAEGLPSVASELRREGLEGQRVDLEGRRVDLTKQENESSDRYRTASLAEQTASREATDRYRAAELKLRAASEGRLAHSAGIEDAVKEISLGNAKRVEALRTEYPTATPDRQNAIREEVQLITGKDNDNYLPVPLKDDMGNVTGYQIFDKKGGKFVQSPASTTPTPTDIAGLKARSSDPKATAFFDSRYGAGAAAKVLGGTSGAPGPTRAAAPATAAPLTFPKADIQKELNNTIMARDNSTSAEEKYRLNGKIADLQRKLAQ